MSCGGNPDAIRAAAVRLQDAASDANQYIMGYMTDDSSGLKVGIDNDHWSGDASEEYKKWIDGIVGDSGYMTRVRNGIWQIGNHLNDAADAIYGIHGDLEIMCVTLLAAAATAGATAGGVPKAAEATVALITAFVVELVRYRNQATEKFRPPITELRKLQSQGGDLIRKKSGTMGEGVPLPVDIYDYFPAAPPIDAIGSWRNWGEARPEVDK